MKLPDLGLRRSPVLAILTFATGVWAIGHGIVFSITVLYFTLIVGFTPGEVALVLTIGQGVGLAASYVGGRIADRVNARWLMVLFVLVEAAGLAAYAFAETVLVATLLASIVFIGSNAERSVRSAVIARAFHGPDRVNARAVIRVVTNLGIAVGAGGGAVALAIGSPFAYHVVLWVAGGLVAVSVFPILRLQPAVTAAPERTATGASRAIDSPLRDPRYLTLTLLAGLFGMQFALLEIGVPLWVTRLENVPTVMVSILLIINTALAVLLQIPLSRGTHDIPKAARISLLAGVLMVLACALYAFAQLGSATLAIAILIGAVVLHTLAEIYSSAASWGLSFELAPTRSAGAYQGVFGTSFGIGAMLAPSVLTLALSYGTAGWIMLAAMFLFTSIGIWALSRNQISADVRIAAAAATAG